ncbi:MAG TPA: glycosyltransferase family 2 protein [Bryobacteraceae bacterium]|jgi:cellulose synthase/poly-beta-1,6-N-acetylglucosamine synthase-like glycosyltransferase|nr:glycosyltransferase family 2 protein [Bryobacteraceae bacterium]
MSVAVILFAASVVFVLYAVIGYPVLLSIYARLFPIPVRKELIYRRVSIVIPVRNGASWIRNKLDSLLDSDYPAELIDVLVVSDGSTDGTNELVEEYLDDRVRLLALAPGGKAVAVSRGLENVSGEIVVLTDVRQPFDKQALSKLVACFADPAVGVVTGELIIREGLSSEEYNTGLYWRYEKWIRRNLNRIDAMLGATGSIYAIRRELAASIPAGVLLDDVYLPFKAAFQGFRIYFEDEAKAYDSPTSLRSEFWRKVRTQAGVYQILFRFPGLLWPGNRRFIHFVSHKLSRLLLPFALLAAAICTWWLPAPWRDIAAVLQIVFYGFAVCDLWVPEHTTLKRLSGTCRAFVVLITAAFCGLTVFFLPSQKLWRETRVENSKAPESVLRAGRRV